MGQKAKTRGGEGGGNGEEAEESRQRPLSRQETSLRSKKIICVGEEKYREPGGLIGTFSTCTAQMEEVQNFSFCLLKQAGQTAFC